MFLDNFKLLGIFIRVELDCISSPSLIKEYPISITWSLSKDRPEVSISKQMYVEGNTIILSCDHTYQTFALVLVF